MVLSEHWVRNLVFAGKTWGSQIGWWRNSAAKEVSQHTAAKRFPSPIIFIVIHGQNIIDNFLDSDHYTMLSFYSILFSISSISKYQEVFLGRGEEWFKGSSKAVQTTVMGLLEAMFTPYRDLTRTWRDITQGNYIRRILVLWYNLQKQ